MQREPTITLSYQTGWNRAFLHYTVDGKGALLLCSSTAHCTAHKPCADICKHVPCVASMQQGLGEQLKRAFCCMCECRTKRYAGFSFAAAGRSLQPLMSPCTLCYSG